MRNRTVPLQVWAQLGDPSDATWRHVAETTFLIGHLPWAWPSRPLTGPTGQATEIREIDVAGTDAVVFYEHEHSTGVVDLLLVQG